MGCLKNWEIKCLKKGDTFKGKIITLPFDITDCTFLMQFRKAEIGINTNVVAFEWSSSDDSFIINDAINGVLYMDKKQITVNPNFYVSDFQITYANGDVETLFDASIKIIDDFSK